MLTESQIAQFRAQGFLKGSRVLSDEEVETLRAELTRVIEQQGRLTRRPVSLRNLSGNPEAPVWQIVNIWEASEPFRALIHHPQIVAEVAQLTGASQLRVWHDQIQYKPAQIGGVNHWHQDAPYWPILTPMTAQVTAWVALDDVDENNGCMQFIAGTHKLGRLPPINLVEPQDIFQLVPPGVQIDPTPAVMRMKAGSCTFHHGLTFHYAGPNRSDRPRRAIVTIYMPDGTTYRKQPHVVTDGLGLEEGQPLAGELFPILAG